jgi:23S rRNA maturation-related 3'-5' exoribonuclease YhaM
MLRPDAITDELRARVRAELPEIDEIRDPELRAKVVEAWALALASSSFGAIGEIEPSGNPGVNTLRRGSQTDHIRGVTRLALRIADEMSALMPDLEVNRDILIAGGLCHDIGKPWEFDPKNRRRWERDPRAAGQPAVRHPAFGVHVCFTAGLRRRWRTAPRHTPGRASFSSARSRTRSCTTPTTRSGRSAAPATCWCQRPWPS